MDDMDLKARQKEELERKLRKNKLNRRYRRNELLMIVSELSLFVIGGVIVFNSFDDMTMGKVIILFAVLSVAMFILSYVFGRCPHCGTWICNPFINEGGYYWGRCPDCGESLEISKSLTQIEKKRQAESLKKDIIA